MEGRSTPNSLPGLDSSINREDIAQMAL